MKTPNTNSNSPSPCSRKVFQNFLEVFLKMCITFIQFLPFSAVIILTYIMALEDVFAVFEKNFKCFTAEEILHLEVGVIFSITSKFSTLSKLHRLTRPKLFSEFSQKKSTLTNGLKVSSGGKNQLPGWRQSSFIDQLAPALQPVVSFVCPAPPGNTCVRHNSGPSLILSDLSTCLHNFLLYPFVCTPVNTHRLRSFFFVPGRPSTTMDSRPSVRQDGASGLILILWYKPRERTGMRHIARARSSRTLLHWLCFIVVQNLSVFIH